MAKLKLGIAVVGVLLLSAAPVLAAQVDGPMFLSSSPEAGEEVHEKPQEVRITFSEPLDDSSQIRVVDACEQRIDNGSVSIDANEMAVGFKATPSGTYTVFYSASGPGGVTGETNGSFQFLVHPGKSCDGSTHGGGEHGGGGSGHGGGGEHGSGGSHKGGGHGSGGGHEDGGHDGSGGHEGSGHSGSSGSHSGSSNHSGSGSHSSSSGHSAGGHSGSGTSHSSGKHSGGRHSSNQHGSGEHGKDDGSTNHAAGHSEDTAVKGTELAAPGAPLAGVEGSAVLMALGAALVLGAGGGWVIRQNNLF